MPVILSRENKKEDKRIFDITFSNPRLVRPWWVTNRVIGVRAKNNCVAALKRRHYNYIVKEIPS